MILRAVQVPRSKAPKEQSAQDAVKTVLPLGTRDSPNDTAKRRPCRTASYIWESSWWARQGSNL